MDANTNNSKIKLTGLWKSKDRNGNTFLSGKLNAVTSLMVMPNTYKKSDKDPDFFVYLRPSKDAAAGDQPKPQTPSFDDLG